MLLNKKIGLSNRIFQMKELLESANKSVMDDTPQLTEHPLVMVKEKIDEYLKELTKC